MEPRNVNVLKHLIETNNVDDSDDDIVWAVDDMVDLRTLPGRTFASKEERDEYYVKDDAWWDKVFEYCDREEKLYQEREQQRLVESLERKQKRFEIKDVPMMMETEETEPLTEEHFETETEVDIDDDEDVHCEFIFVAKPVDEQGYTADYDTSPNPNSFELFITDDTTQEVNEIISIRDTMQEVITVPDDTMETVD